MAILNQLTSEAAAVVATIDPDAYGVGTENSDGIDMSQFEMVMFVLQLGDLVTSAEVDMDITSGSDNSTFGNTVKSVTQLTEAGTDSNKQVIVTVRGEELTKGDQFIRAELTFATAGGDAAVVALGFNPKHGPASDNDLASVDEIVS